MEQRDLNETGFIQKQRQTKATLFTLPAHRVRPSRIRVRPLEVNVNKECESL